MGTETDCVVTEELLDADVQIWLHLPLLSVVKTEQLICSYQLSVTNVHIYPSAMHTVYTQSK